jgi:NarL family two-component system response regulator LiaR
MSRSLRVLLVDDHAMVREGVRGFLGTQADLEVVGEAATGRDAIGLALDLDPDVIILDVVLPDMECASVIRGLADAGSRSRILVVTSYSGEEHVLPALSAGAHSYVLKDIGPAELADAVRRTAAGEAVLAPRVAGQLVGQLRGAGEPRAIRELSRRELEVLCMIAEGAGNAAIAARLSISEKTVKSHVGSILSKLHLADRTQAAVLAWRQGLVRRG